MGFDVRRFWRKHILGQPCDKPNKGNYKFLLKSWIGVFDHSACAQVLETKRFSQQVEPLLMDRPEGERILVIAPHSDDEIIGPGGTLLKALAAGARAEVVCVTGEYADDARTRTMRAESRAVWEEIGVEGHFLGCRVRDIPLDDEAVLDRFCGIVESFDPDVVFTTFMLDDHDDHRSVNHLLTQCLERTGLRPEIWAYQVYSTVIPNVVVDITNQVEEKRHLIHMWRSVNTGRDWAHYIIGLNAFNSRFNIGPGKRYTETFLVVPAREYMELCRLYFNSGNVFTGKSYRDRKAVKC